jgi:hypothetical protein
LSYSLDPTEMALAWRLQTLAAAHGIEMYVPRMEPAQMDRKPRLRNKPLIAPTVCWRSLRPLQVKWFRMS